ncbi:hypothetical protein V8E36_006670 [Tilletia maclaganii]
MASIITASTSVGGEGVTTVIETVAPLTGTAAAQTLSSILASASESNIIHGTSPTEDPPIYKVIGIILAVGSGILIGSSFVWKKKGLLASQRKYNSTAGEGHDYLKSWLWWTGMIIMVLGEICNFVAYAFAPAVLVTPMGSISVVFAAILSHFLLKESLTLFGSIGCFLCLVGSVIIALNGPEQHASGDITVFRKMFLNAGFLVWMGISIVASLLLAFWAAPKYGKKNMLVYIGICSLIGGLSVSTTSGLGSAILLSIRGENQFKNWFIYILLAFVVCTLLIEINYLNKALELFNTAMVTPTYYVLFTTCTLISSIVLFQGLQASAIAILTIVLGFLVICSGITLLQLSKVDPADLANKPGLDRRTTMLLRASQSHVSLREKQADAASHVEEPGLDTVRGGMGVVGSLLRARSSRRIASGVHTSADAYGVHEMGNSALPLHSPSHHHHHHGGSKLHGERYQLYDAPVGGGGAGSDGPMPARRGSHISFASNTTGGPQQPQPGNPSALYAGSSAPGGLAVPGGSGNTSRDSEPPSIILKDRPRSSGGVQQYGASGAGTGAGEVVHEINMRRYGTEPASKALAGIREASGESGGGFSHLTRATSSASGGGGGMMLGPEVTHADQHQHGRGSRYVDPYYQSGDGSRGEAIAMPVLLRGNGGSGATNAGGAGSANSPSDIRTMWSQQQTNDSMISLEDKTSLSSPTKEHPASGGGGGPRWASRSGDRDRARSGGAGSSNSSDSEEEVRLLKEQKRGRHTP